MGNGTEMILKTLILMCMHITIIKFTLPYMVLCASYRQQDISGHYQEGVMYI